VFLFCFKQKSYAALNFLTRRHTQHTYIRIKNTHDINIHFFSHRILFLLFLVFWRLSRASPVALPQSNHFFIDPIYITHAAAHTYTVHTQHAHTTRHYTAQSFCCYVELYKPQKQHSRTRIWCVGVFSLYCEFHLEEK
jgi:hypothetical protein